ncbi:MAG: response regulator [Myxococcales bacterium]|nr:response regulator [Myxococcales bacterium]
MLPRVLIVEDGFEYRDTFSRFAGDSFRFVRAGDGAEALAVAATQAFDVLFLDMRFDRIEAGRLFGDLPETAERFNGDPVRATRFLEDNQGVYILAALRAAGVATPAVFSHDFSGEPRRWGALKRKYAPVAWLGDNASPAEVKARLADSVRSHPEAPPTARG